MRFIKILIISVLLQPALSLKAQVNDAQQTLLTECLNQIYKMDFEAAETAVKRYYERNSSSTTKYILRSYYLRWRYLPITQENNQVYQQFYNLLDSAITSAENKIKKNPDNVEEHYYKMSAHIMKAELHASNGDMVKAAFEGKNAFSIIKKGFDWCYQYPEFYISTGLYNYYIEFYREKGFFYQSLLWPFSSGDKAKGLEFLKLGNEHATFTAVESKLYLAHLYFKLENKPFEGLKYSRELIEEFPNNTKFQEMYAENLLACKKIEEANVMIAQLEKHDNKYTAPKAKLFQGMWLLQHNGDFAKAKKLIENALLALEKLPGDHDHFKSLAFLKLGELEKISGNIKASNDHFKKAKSLAKYRYILEQIEQNQS